MLTKTYVLFGVSSSELAESFDAAHDTDDISLKVKHFASIRRLESFIRRPQKSKTKKFFLVFPHSEIDTMLPLLIPSAINIEPLPYCKSAKQMCKIKNLPEILASLSDAAYGGTSFTPLPASA